MRIRILLTLAVVILPCSAGAQTAVSPTTSEEQARQFARDRITDGQQLLFGPERPVAPVVSDTDCQALYARRVALMHGQSDYRRPYYDEPRHQAATFIGTIWNPAFYYLPYRAVSELIAHENESANTVELDALRAASAAQRCFER